MKIHQVIHRLGLAMGLGVIMIGTGCGSIKTPDALSFFQEEKLVIGWNLGNGMDAHSGGVSGETRWGNPRIGTEIFEGIKKAGFNVVRVPVTWMGHIGPGPDYQIDPAFLERVAEVVSYAHGADLKVIINIHHDGAAGKDGAGRITDSGWLSINTARKSPDGMRQVSAQLERVWAQIAKHFKNEGDYLIFESMNEIHDGNWGWGNEADQRPQYEILNQWNQIFVDAVRAAGGGNTRRFLVIPAYCTSARHTTADYFKLPRDPANKDNKLIVTFHYYDPYEFGIAATRQDWGSPADKDKVDRDFKPLADKFIAGKKIPVIIGESGAVRQEGAEKARLEYLAYVYGKAHELGLVPFYWDNGAFGSGGENFGLFDRRSGAAYSEESALVVRTMMDAIQ